MQMVYLDSERLRSVYNYQNWDYNNQLILTAVIPFKVGGWWDSRLTLNALFGHAKASHYYDAPFDNRQWTGIGSWTNTFILSQKPNIKFEVTAFGQTKALQGSYRIQPIGSVNAALRYTFAGDKAMIQLKGTDIFNGYNHFNMKVRNGARASRHGCGKLSARYYPVVQLQVRRIHQERIKRCRHLPVWFVTVCLAVKNFTHRTGQRYG